MRVGKADGEAWLRLSEAADALGISLNTLRRWSDSGKLTCYRSPGGHRRYRSKDVEALLHRQLGQDPALSGGSPASGSDAGFGPSHAPPPSALATLAQVAAEGIGVTSCFLAVVEGDGRLRVAASYARTNGGATPGGGEILTRDGAPVADEVQHTQRRVVIADVSATNLLTPAEVDACRARRDVAVLALPLAFDGRFLGVLQLVERGTARAFTAADITFAEFVARQAASLIARTSDVDPGAARPPASATALRMEDPGDSGPLPATGDVPPATLRALAERLRRRLGVVACDVYALTPDDSVTLVAATGPDDARPEPGGTTWRLDDLGGTKARLLRGETVSASLDDSRLTAAHRQRLERSRAQHLTLIPLRLGNDTRGLLEILSETPRLSFAQDETDLIEASAAVAALALKASGEGREPDATATDLDRLVERASLTTATLERRVRDLETIVQAGIEDATKLSTDEVLHALIQRLAELTHSPVADVYAVEGGTLRALISYDAGRFDPEWEGVVVPINRYPCSRRAIESGEIAVAASLEDEILGADGRYSLERWGYQSQLSMPLVSGGRVIGLVELSDYVARDFGEHLELIRGLGRVAAQALENARLFELVERRSRILNELVDLGAFASTSRDFGAVLRRVAERVLSTMGAANCDIYRASADGLRCEISYDRSGFDEEAVGRLLDVTQYPTLVAAATSGRLLVVSSPDDPQLSEREREVYREYGFGSEVCVPLIVNDELFGLIDIYDTRPRSFSEYLSFLRSLGMSLAGAFASTLLLEQLEHRTAVLREIVELGAVAAQGGALEPMLATLAERVRATVGAAGCDVYALEGERLRCLASVDDRGLDRDAVGESVRVADFPVIDMALRTREPLVVASLDDPRVTDEERGDYAQWGYRSLVSIPLSSGDEVVGAVDVFDTSERDYGDYLDFLRSAGQIIASAVRNARLLGDLTVRNRALAELVELGRLATGEADTTALLRALTERVTRLVGVAGCQVFVREGERLRCLFAWEDGRESPADVGRLIDIDRFPSTRRALDQGLALVVTGPDDPGLSEDERRHYEETEWRSDAVVPLAIEERIIGLLEVYDRRPRDYAEHLDFLRQAGQIVAGALEKARLVDRLEGANAQLGHLVEAGLEIGATLDDDEVLRRVAERLCAAAQARSCDIYAIEGDTMRCLASVEDGVSDEAFLGTVYEIDRFDGVRETIATGSILVVGDVERDQRISSFERAENARYGHRAKVELPLVAGGKVVGLASIFDQEARDFDDLEMLQSLAQLAANALANAALYDELAESTRRVGLVSDVSFELSSSLDLGEVLQNTANRLCALADMPCCDLYTLDGDRRLTCVVSLVDGETDETWQGRSFALEGWSALSAAVERRMPIVIASPDDALLSAEERALMHEFAETAEVIFPLISKDVVIGVLELLENRGPRTFGEEEIATIAAVCRVAALAIDNARLYEDIKGMHLGNLKALSSALNAKDYYTLGHAARVAAYMVLLGEELGWSPELQREVEEAAYLHDIGKIGVSDRVLLKAGGLNPREWELMRRHPAYSADIIRPLFTDELTAGVRHHHERYDGSGYPDGLAGDEIPLIARAMCVVDSYDAMSFRRPYRQALTYTACREELSRCAGSQFDPAMVAAFERVLERLRELKAAAVAVAGQAAKRVDHEAHAGLLRREDEDSDAYRAVAETLRAVRDAHPPTRYVTTFARRGSAAVLVADAEEDPALHSPIGDETFSDEEILHVFAGEPADRTVLFVDHFGVWISGAAPIRDHRGEIVAVANADLPATTGSTEVDGLRSDVTRTFATMVADAAAQLGHAELEAITDGLTGLYNHRYLHERLDEEIERCVYQGGSLVLLLVDLDDFRAFNDRYGHSAGDRALRSVARIIETSLRQVDLAARFGGEEFAVILIDADETGAREVAERIRNGIVDADFTLGHGSLSVSIGMALCPSDATHKEELLDKADWAMYLAKRRGRDQVVSFGAEHGVLTPEQVLSVHEDHVSALAGVVSAGDALTKRRRAAVTHLALAAARELGLGPDEMHAVVAAATVGSDGVPTAPTSGSLPEQLAAVAARYEALVTRAPYRPQISEAEALQELRSCPAFEHDARLWEAFETVLARPRA